jgi:hypothetical protein
MDDNGENPSAENAHDREDGRDDQSRESEASTRPASREASPMPLDNNPAREGQPPELPRMTRFREVPPPAQDEWGFVRQYRVLAHAGNCNTCGQFLLHVMQAAMTEDPSYSRGRMAEQNWWLDEADDQNKHLEKKLRERDRKVTELKRKVEELEDKLQKEKKERRRFRQEADELRDQLEDRSRRERRGSDDREHKRARTDRMEGPSQPLSAGMQQVHNLYQNTLEGSSGEDFPDLPQPGTAPGPGGPSLRGSSAFTPVKEERVMKPMTSEELDKANRNVKLGLPPPMGRTKGWKAMEVDQFGRPATIERFNSMMNRISGLPESKTTREIATMLRTWVGGLNAARMSQGYIPTDLERHALMNWQPPPWLQPSKNQARRGVTPREVPAMKMPNVFQPIEMWLDYIERTPKYANNGIRSPPDSHFDRVAHRPRVEGYLAIARLAPREPTEVRRAFTREMIALALVPGEYLQYVQANNMDINPGRTDGPPARVGYCNDVQYEAIKHMTTRGVTLADLQSWSAYAVTYAEALSTGVPDSDIIRAAYIRRMSTPALAPAGPPPTVVASAPAAAATTAPGAAPMPLAFPMQAPIMQTAEQAANENVEMSAPQDTPEADLGMPIMDGRWDPEEDNESD